MKTINITKALVESLLRSLAPSKAKQDSLFKELQTLNAQQEKANDIIAHLKKQQACASALLRVVEYREKQLLWMKLGVLNQTFPNASNDQWKWLYRLRISVEDQNADLRQGIEHAERQLKICRHWIFELTHPIHCEI